MASLTVENYVKTIYHIAAGGERRAATTGEIAAALAVSPGTVTAMLKTLDAAGLATYTPYEGVSLTRSGRVLALRVLRRHRLIELFLMRTLGLAWDEVHDEAEHMEHAVSDTLVERIDAYLGRPNVDPHGDPIPAADAHSLGPPVEERMMRLSDCRDGLAFRLSRVLDQSAEFLRFLTDAGLSLGAGGTVERNPDGAGLMRVRIGRRSFPLSLEAAAKLQVSGD
jgi:DtxR family Mn-dependent transcriptional regulator